MKNRRNSIAVSLEPDGQAMVAIDITKRFHVKGCGDHWCVTTASEHLESQLNRFVFMTRDGAIIACVLVLLDEI